MKPKTACVILSFKILTQLSTLLIMKSKILIKAYKIAHDLTPQNLSDHILPVSISLTVLQLHHLTCYSTNMSSILSPNFFCVFFSPCFDAFPQDSSWPVLPHFPQFFAQIPHYQRGLLFSPISIIL